jgi:hypothetical protein
MHEIEIEETLTNVVAKWCSGSTWLRRDTMARKRQTIPVLHDRSKNSGDCTVTKASELYGFMRANESMVRATAALMKIE